MSFSGGGFRAMTYTWAVSKALLDASANADGFEYVTHLASVSGGGWGILQLGFSEALFDKVKNGKIDDVISTWGIDYMMTMNAALANKTVYEKFPTSDDYQCPRCPYCGGGKLAAYTSLLNKGFTHKGMGPYHNHWGKYITAMFETAEAGLGTSSLKGGTRAPQFKHTTFVPTLVLPSSTYLGSQDESKGRSYGFVRLNMEDEDASRFVAENSISVPLAWVSRPDKTGDWLHNSDIQGFAVSSPDMSEWIPRDECAPTFTYKNKLYTGCTTDDVLGFEPQAWCSYSPIYESGLPYSPINGEGQYAVTWAKCVPRCLHLCLDPSTRAECVDSCYNEVGRVKSFELAQEPLVFEVAGASSAAVGFASSPLMFADSSHGKFDAYAVAECAIGSPTVNFGQTIGDPEGVRFIDGGFADNSGAAFMVAQMQKDCLERPDLYNCANNTISIVVVDVSMASFNQSAMRNLFQYPTSRNKSKIESGGKLEDYNLTAGDAM